jgi:hypothetical protein
LNLITKVAATVRTLRTWATVKHGIDVIEHPFAGHEDFGTFRFLGGGAVDAERARNFLLLHQVLDRQRSAHRPGADEIVAAAVT